MTTQEVMGLRIKALREEKNMSQSTLAELVGYKDKTAIAKVEAGKIDLPQSKISAFAKVLNTTTSYLFADNNVNSLVDYDNYDEYIPEHFDGDVRHFLAFQEAVEKDYKTAADSFYRKIKTLVPSEMDLVEKYRALDNYGQETIDATLDRETKRIEKYGKLSESAPTVPTRIISYYFKNASAGTGQIVIDNLPEKDIEIPDKPEYRNVSYAIGVNGNSMEPVFHDGDILLVEATQEINIGEIGIFQIDDLCYVKELGETSLISLNKDYSDIPLNESVRIQGKVIDTI